MSRNTENDMSEHPPVPALARLPAERAPEHDLWPGIAARLRPAISAPVATPMQPRMTRRRRWPLALAASLCVVSLAGLLMPQLSAQFRAAGSVNHRVQSAIGQLSASRLERETTLAAAPSSGASAAIANASAVLVASREILASSLPNGQVPARTLRSETGEWPQAANSGLMHAAYNRSERPARRVNGSALGEWQASVRADASQQALLRANLRLMRDAEREVNKALRADPDSDSLQEMLKQLHDQRHAISRLLVASRD